VNKTPLVHDLRAIGYDPVKIVSTIHAAFEEYRGRIEPESGALSETVVSLFGKAHAGIIFGILDDEILAACVRATPKANALYLDRLAVHPAYRRRGFAEILILAVETEARRRRFQSVTLGVRLALESNISLFSKLGFLETGRSTHDGFDAPTSMDMEKRLGSSSGRQSNWPDRAPTT
jgi:ribosomal protein S18 acetylase RimI-like enzyme